jgi:ABC-2 type transport system permease protein
VTTTTIPHVGVPGLRLIRSEIRKIFTTNAWWLFVLASVPITGIAILANMAQARDQLNFARDTTPLELPQGMDPKEAAEIQAQFAQDHDLPRILVESAANIYTSGQFFGLVLVMLLGALVITNEFQYQTATATFLTTPRRSRVVLGKLVAGMGLAIMFWLLAQSATLISGMIFFKNVGLDNGLGEWPVQRAIIFNGTAYLLWAVFGFGLGTLIRNQIGTVVTGMAIYLVGYIGGIGFFVLVRNYLIHGDWVLTAAVSMPSIASQIMISPEKLYPESAVWWVGAVSMIGWSLLAGTIGVLLTRRRDIS